ncbi:hypothetical protein PMAYCL1PPCAC_01175, partial [Pristionchus mayeri]
SKLLKWINAVRSTPEGRRSLMERLSAHKASFLCSSHFSPADFNVDGGRYTVLRSNAIPFFEIYCPSTGTSRSIEKTKLPLGELSIPLLQSLSDINIFLQPYACLTCGKQFSGKDLMRGHLVTNEGHTGTEEVTSV